MDSRRADADARASEEDHSLDGRASPDPRPRVRSVRILMPESLLRERSPFHHRLWQRRNYVAIIRNYHDYNTIRKSVFNGLFLVNALIDLDAESTSEIVGRTRINEKVKYLASESS